MFKSLLNAVGGNLSTDSLILNILIILGVVVAGALVLYLLWEIVSYIVSRTKKSGEPKKAPDLGKKQEPNKKHDDVLVVDYSLDAEQTPEEEHVVEEQVTAPVAEEPIAQEPVEETVLDETQLEEVNEEKVEEEKAEADAETSSEEEERNERRAYLEARRQEIIRRMQADAENEEETEEETEEPEVEQVAEPETVEEEPQVDQLAEEREALNAEKARYETMVRELEAAKRALAEQKKETKVETRVETVVENLTLEELKQRLAEAEERLKTTEKEFKQCKKEYTPLRKVWVTHEKDEKKLRRKEALVAKQKVILYGVNNYADIDEEKAKKLAEDLDLLDGLKLSVQHCEEVMKKNEERYPYLEKMYNVLKLRNDELKADIAKYKQEIERIESEQN